MPIFDQGYQHWDGQLSGRAWRWLAIARHGVRTQVKGRYVRRLLFMAWVPALALVATLACWGLLEQGVLGSESWLPWFMAVLTKSADLHACRTAVWTIAYSYFFQSELYFIMLLVMLTGPNLISRDMRFNALPLYLSRPITRFDYFIGKLGMIGALVAAVAVLPAVAAYVLGVCFSFDLSVIRDTWRLLPGSILYGLLIVVSAGTLMLALSSLSRRSLYVGLAWAGVWLIGFTVCVALEWIRHDTIADEINDARIRTNAPEETAPPRHRPRRHGPDMFGPPNEEAIKRALAESAPSDWRPLFSYTANLERLGDAILKTDSAWVDIVRSLNSSSDRATMMFQTASGKWPTGGGKLLDDRSLADQSVMQYPWKWSAAVLAGLFGISLWIVSMRVKSLDRLR